MPMGLTLVESLWSYRLSRGCFANQKVTPLSVILCSRRVTNQSTIASMRPSSPSFPPLSLSCDNCLSVRPYSRKYYDILEKRNKLPVHQFLEDLMEKVRRHNSFSAGVDSQFFFFPPTF